MPLRSRIGWVVDANMRLMKDINSLTILPATSVATQVASSVNNVLATVRRNINDSSVFLQRFIGVYSDEVKFTVRGLTQSALTTASQLAEVQLVLLSPSDKPLSVIDIEKMKLLTAQLEYFRHLWSNFMTTSGYQFNYSGFPNLTSSANWSTHVKYLESNLTSVSKLLRDIIERCNMTSESGSIECETEDENEQSSAETVFQKPVFKTASNLLYQSLLNVSSDLLEYEKQLYDMVTWLNSAFNSLNNISISPSLRPSATLLNAFNGNASYLVAQYERYLAADISTANFARSIAHLTFYANIQTSVTSIIDELNKSVWTPLTSILDTKEALLVDTHYTLLTKFASLQQFFTADDTTSCTDRLRKLSLWQKPSVSRQNQELTYSLTADQTSTVWSRDISLNAFVGGAGRSIISLLVGQICDEIRSYVNDAQSSVIADLTSLSSATTQLLANLYSYIQRVDDGLQRENFIKVDIYYGELKSETIVQSLAYDIASFFGDLGGFYGLCLGGSAITLFEIIDLIIYNMFLNMTTRKNKQSVDANFSTGTRNNMDSMSINGHSEPGVVSQTQLGSEKLSKRWRPSYSATNFNDFAL